MKTFIRSDRHEEFALLYGFSYFLLNITEMVYYIDWKCLHAFKPCLLPISQDSKFIFQRCCSWFQWLFNNTSVHSSWLWNDTMSVFYLNPYTYTKNKALVLLLYRPPLQVLFIFSVYFQHTSSHFVAHCIASLN